MLIDARQVEDGSTIETDICIVGGGPAGITLALELVDSPLKVLLLESGGMTFDDETQDLYDGPLLGFQYEPLDEARMRFLGGSSNHWTGHCLPLTPVDFEKRDWMAHSGWPIGYDDVAPYYTRAQPYFELETELAYDFAAWEDKIGTPGLAVDPQYFENVVINESPPTAFGFVYEDRLRQAENLTVYLNANALELDVDDTASTVTGIQVVTIDGPRFTVTAKRVALSAGGIEIPRLMLGSNKVATAGIGNGAGLVGRFFGDHAAVRPAMRLPMPEPVGRLDLYTEPHWFEVSGFLGAIGASQDILRREEVAGFLFHLFADQTSPGLRGMRQIVRSARRGEAPPYLSSQIRNVLADMDGVTNAFYKWAFDTRDTLIDHEWLGPWLTFECVPNPDSRVLLVEDKDRFGKHKIGLDWQLTEQEMRTVKRATELFAREVGRLGLGRAWTEVMREDYVWPDYVARGKHHCGTTRMSETPKTGVVDANCRVHGMSNLYVNSSAVFPTNGYANPTLTIGAMAIRMADLFRADAARGAL